MSLFLACAALAWAAGEARIKKAEDAIAAAEPALITKFGKEEIARQRPFRVRVTRDKKHEAIWIVEGAEPKAPKGVVIFGGVVFASVRESDGQVIDVFMWK